VNLLALRARAYDGRFARQTAILFSRDSSGDEGGSSRNYEVREMIFQEVQKTAGIICKPFGGFLISIFSRTAYNFDEA